MDDSDYVKSYRQLVAEVGDSLSNANTAALDYVYKENLTSAPARPRDGKPWKTGLGLLRALETSRVFSPRQPHSLVVVMKDAKRPDLQERVQRFIDTHEATIAKFAKSAVPPKPSPKPKSRSPPSHVTTVAKTTTEKDSPFYPTATNLKTQASSSSSSSSDDDGYTHFVPTSRIAEEMKTQGLEMKGAQVSPQSSIGSVDSSSRQTVSEEEEYSYPYTQEWGIMPLLNGALQQKIETSQKMRLLTKPIREMIRSRKNCTLTSAEIPFLDRSMLFKLHIDPIGPCRDGLGATVYLLNKKPVVKTGRILKAKLVVSSPRKKHGNNNEQLQRRHNDYYSAPFTLFDSTVVMDLPPEATKFENMCIVARFPFVLSHQNLENKRLANYAPFLDLRFTIRQCT